MKPMKRVLQIAGLAFWIVSAVAPAALAQERLWFLESTTVNDFLGGAAIGPDLDGDGISELLVTAPGEACTNPDDGTATIYSIPSGELQKWCGTGGWNFGSGAVWADDVDGGGVPDVVIGESSYYDPIQWGSDTGRYQVYSVETASLIYEVVGTMNNGRFGGPKVIVDDYDGDGLRDLLLGADAYGVNAEGRAWIFSMRTGAVIRTHNGAVAFGRLGRQVHALNDVDGDGVRDYAIYADGAWGSVGRLNVFSGASGKSLLKISGVGNSDQFGYATAAPGDLDGDGIADIVLGGMSPDGHIDAYSVITGNLIWRIDGAPSTNEGFGFNVLALSDLNGDGDQEFLVTAAYDDRDSRDAGRVDLMSGRTHRALFRFYSGIRGYYAFGNVLAGGDDFNGDGIEDLVIGGTTGGTTESEGGHVAIYAGNDLWLQAEPPEPAVGDTVVVDLRGAEAGRLGLLALIDVDGTALFEALLVAPFDSNGELQLTADIDPSVSGMQFTLMAWAQNRTGRGKLMDATPFVVTVQ